MTANISIVSAQRDNVLKVPLAALRFRPPRADGKNAQNGQQQNSQSVSNLPAVTPAQEGSRQVWIETDQHKLTALAVQVGISDDTFAELLGGSLHEGDTVVTGMRSSGSGDSASQPTVPGFGMRWRR